jgi:hypothetical protein
VFLPFRHLLLSPVGPSCRRDFYVPLFCNLHPLRSGPFAVGRARRGATYARHKTGSGAYTVNSGGESPWVDVPPDPVNVWHYIDMPLTVIESDAKLPEQERTRA